MKYNEDIIYECLEDIPQTHPLDDFLESMEEEPVIEEADFTEPNKNTLDWEYDEDGDLVDPNAPVKINYVCQCGFFGPILSNKLQCPMCRKILKYDNVKKRIIFG